ncbi:MAG: hypothetical protein NZ750_10180 [Anaerolineae bacterium]|nr:hypothetical protein [Anaerolineae bacterium]MDW8172650.1 hypothetical protein [Anaerolineae bacterium]
MRRIGRRDRKDSLKPSGPLIPPEQAAPQGEAEALPDFLAKLPNPDDSAALAALSSLPDDAVRLKVTPSEERFPPLPPAPLRAEDDLPNEPSADAARTRPNLRSAVPSVPPKPVPSVWGYNLVTALALLGTLGLVVVYAILWVDPYSPLNPLPPPVFYVQVTATPEPQPSAPASMVFQLAAQLQYIGNTNERGCAWASVVGTVSDSQGRPLNGYRLRVRAADFDETVFSGSAPQWGEGGFELALASAPLARDYTIQLFSPQGQPLSDAYLVSTRADCAQNVVVLAFTAR